MLAAMVGTLRNKTRFDPLNHIENLENLDPVQYGKSMDTGAIQYEALWTCLFQGSSFNKQTVNVYIF